MCIFTARLQTRFSYLAIKKGLCQIERGGQKPLPFDLFIHTYIASSSLWVVGLNMVERGPDWDKYIYGAEERYLQGKWSEFSSRQKFQVSKNNLAEVEENFLEDDKSLDILDDIAKEQDRINPDSSGCIDQEEVYRATGRYPFISREIKDDDD